MRPTVTESRKNNDEIRSDLKSGRLDHSETLRAAIARALPTISEEAGWLRDQCLREGWDESVIDLVNDAVMKLGVALAVLDTWDEETPK